MKTHSLRTGLRYLLFALAAGASALCGSAVAGARSTESLALTRQSGNYTVEIDSPNPFAVGQKNFVDFYLLDGAGTSQSFSDVRVIVLDSAQEGIFDADVAKKPGSAAPVTFFFPAAGNYTLETIFYSGSAQLAQASFPITVGAVTRRNPAYLEWLVGGFCGGIVVALACAPLLRRYERTVLQDS